MYFFYVFFVQALADCTGVVLRSVCLFVCSFLWIEANVLETVVICVGKYTKHVTALCEESV
jgi:hypothetical protein